MVDGEWFLVKVIDTEEGVETEFERGLIRWGIDETYRSLYIANYNTTDVYDGPETIISAPYSFTNVPDVCNRSLIIDDIEYGCIERNGDTLTISNEHIDGYIFTLIR